MYPFEGATRVDGRCRNCGGDLVLFVRADGAILPHGIHECPDCEHTDFRPA